MTEEIFNLPLKVARAAKRGCPESMALIVDHYREKIRRMAWSINRGRNVAEDLESEGVFAIVEAIREGRLRLRLSLWALINRVIRFKMFAFMREYQRVRSREVLLDDLFARLEVDGLTESILAPVDLLDPATFSIIVEENAGRKIPRLSSRGQWGRVGPIRARFGFCRRGHAMRAPNVIFYKNKNAGWGMARRCKTCRNLWKKKRYLKEKMIKATRN